MTPKWSIKYLYREFLQNNLIKSDVGVSGGTAQKLKSSLAENSCRFRIEYCLKLISQKLIAFYTIWRQTGYSLARFGTG